MPEVEGQGPEASPSRYISGHWKSPPTPGSSLHLQLSLDTPEVLEGLCSLAVGMAQLDLNLIEVALHLFLEPDGLIPAAHFSVQGTLHGLHSPLVVPLQLLNFFILLCNLSINL